MIDEEETAGDTVEDISEAEAGPVEDIVVDAVATSDALSRPLARVAVHEHSVINAADFTARHEAREAAALPHQPLTILLPRMSSVSNVEHFREGLESRYKQLQAIADRGLRERMAEESMLNQVLQWLQIADTSKR